MRPHVTLDTDDLRTNARAWRAVAGVPLRAVVKANGYGWGIETIVRALDEVVDGYYVADAGEFRKLRPLSSKPIVTLGDVAPSGIRELLERGGIPTISAIDGFDAAGAWARANERRARVRVAIRNATGWSGIAFDDVPAVAAVLARSSIDVELSSHVTDPSLAETQAGRFADARRALTNAGVSLVASDLASTAPLAADARNAYSHVRVGIGLFGARYAANVAVVSALRVDAPIVAREPARGQRTGYGRNVAPNGGHLAVLRCGYGDGFPVPRSAYRGILAVGMQFTTVHATRPFDGPSVALVDRDTDLDALAGAAGIAPHHVVVALGNARRSLRVEVCGPE